MKKPRNIHAHALEQGQFKPQIIRNKRLDYQSIDLDEWLEEAAAQHHQQIESSPRNPYREVDQDIFDNLLDPDWNL